MGEYTFCCIIWPIWGSFHTFKLLLALASDLSVPARLKLSPGFLSALHLHVCYEIACNLSLCLPLPLSVYWCSLNRTKGLGNVSRMSRGKNLSSKGIIIIWCFCPADELGKTSPPCLQWPGARANICFY